MSITSTNRASFRITKVETNEANGNISGNAIFHLKITEHVDDEDMVGREFQTTFWEPDPENSTQLQLQASVARWKQLILATGVTVEDNEIDPHEFHMEEFEGQIYQRKNKKTGKSYADLGTIHFPSDEDED